MRISSLVYICLLTIFYSSCLNDLDQNDLSERSATNIRTNSQCDSSLSMDVKRTMKVKTENQNDTLCTIDLLHYLQNYEKFSIQTCVNEKNESCIYLDFDLSWKSNLRNPNRKQLTNDYLDKPKRVAICDGTISYTTESGTTETFATETSSSFLTGLDLNMFQTPVNIDSLEILVFNNNPGEVTILENYFLITNVQSNGNVVKTYIDRINGMTRYSETIDTNGEVIDKTIYEYICLGGKLLPKSIIDIIKQFTPECNTEIWTMQWSSPHK